MIGALGFRDSPLNELALKRPSDMMSRYSISATNDGSTHVALGFFVGLVSLDFGLTVSQLLANLTWDRARPTGADLPQIDQLFPLPLAKIESGDARGIFQKSKYGKFFPLDDFDFQPGFSSF